MSEEMETLEISEVDTEETNQGNIDTQETTEEEPKVVEEFDPENLFDDGEGINYKFGNYDLSKFKDDLNFEDEELVKEFNEYANKYEQMGFTQEQVEFLLQDKIDEIRNVEEPKKPTKAEIKQRLQENLSNEEIRNYKPTTNYVRGLVKGSEFEGRVNEIMQNPTLVKLFHTAYKNSLGKTTNIGNVNKPKEKQIRAMSYDEAKNQLLDAISNGTADDSYIKTLRNTVADREAFDEILQALGKI